VESSPVAVEETVVEAAPVVIEPVPVLATPAPRPVAAPAVRTSAPAAVAPAPRGLPQVQAYTVSIDELNQVAAASGLVWVNSDSDKVAQVQAAIAAEPKPIHVPREIKPAVILDEGPLVLVETRKDLRSMPLPFETQ
jgi:ribonuclease E